MQRVGFGYDAHRFAGGRRLVLAGVEVPFELGLHGYSDADVLTHAVIDALLGAAGLGDIGSHFPSSDPEYEGISSLELLRRTGKLLEREGWTPVNVDVTAVLERPRLAPYADRMRSSLARALGIARDQVSVKSKTTDGLGFPGRSEGIEAHAVALIERP
ncbi:MAG: 2-C-methyl-D-erythritol 2,4-cyclodiphosphate synthase [Chloroflexi bacterium]|nr:2-C-methyl-D-erythritol 2,4-cyclodiphosphate synthase [Chloroflexota bacterium]